MVLWKGNIYLSKFKQKRFYNPVIWLSFIKKQFCIENNLSFYPGIINEDVL